MKTTRSSEEYHRAELLFPGGVNSPVRAFRNVKRDPLFIEKGQGAWLFDVDGNRYLDYVGSWGPLLFGHAHPEILNAIHQAAQRGTSFGAPTPGESQLAELIRQFFPSMQMMRFVNSGTEATMSALRLARGFTGRAKFIKFAGCYHGHGDSFLVKAGSGALTFGEPDSAGVTKGTATDTLTATYNNLEEVETLFANNPDQIACVIVEPVVGNMGTVPPQPGYLQGLRKLCDDNKALLIFDEVMTGFRVAKGGAQERFEVKPDLTTLGKIIGGGLPVGAYGGSAEIMQSLSPLGKVYQAGTLSGNPLAVAAGTAMLKLIQDNPGVYEQLEKKGQKLCDGLQLALQKASIPGIVQRVGSMFTLFFTERQTIENLDQVLACDRDKFVKFFNGMLAKEVYLAPSPFEAAFMGAAHSESDIDMTIKAAEEVLLDMARAGK
ncbi:MAG: glutamate-1-semialdehyde 2,1-aminomutase [Leptospiraceae bacterium]|nr:glutamate-1-semialdehyde 2,1-aminomutase [Leptospiraceae bacterium]